MDFPHESASDKTQTAASPARTKKLRKNSSERRWAHVGRRILKDRLTYVVVPPLVMLGALAYLSIPLLNDLRMLSEDDLVSIQSQQPGKDHEGSMIVHVKNINPNNGIATLDLTYVTDDIDSKKVELWIVSGGVTHKEGKLIYDVNAELHRVPVVMDSPTVFVWGSAKRATYKHRDVEIKIKKRNQGNFYPFDRYDVELSFAVIDEQQRPLFPSLLCEFEDPHFIHYRPGPIRTHGDASVVVPNSLAVSLERPIYQKIFLGISMFMGLGSVLWSLYKITYTPMNAMESLSLLGFDFTVLLAVPALRSVFVPANLQFAPLFDFFVVLIWSVGLVALCVNIVRHDIVHLIRKISNAVASEANGSDADGNRMDDGVHSSGQLGLPLGVVGVIPQPERPARKGDAASNVDLNGLRRTG